MTKKHSHYYKDVTNLTEVDVYRVCQLFGINDPSGALQHAIKKLLVAGGRGAGKDETRDIREAIDTLTRYIEMKEELQTPIPVRVINAAGPNVEVEVKKTDLGIEIRLLEGSIKVYLLNLMTELQMCCGTGTSKGRLSELAAKLQKLVEEEHGCLMVAGLPCIVANEPDTADSMDTVMEFKIKGANAVMITERLYKELKDSANHVKM